MDGVIFNTERLWVYSVIKTNIENNYNVPEELIIDCIGCRNDEIECMLKMKMGDNFDSKLFLSLNEKYMNQYVELNGIPIKKGLFELLNYLKSNRIKIAIASSSSMNRIEKCLMDAKIAENYFEYIISGDDIEKSKPDPEIYEKAVRRLNVDKDKVFVIEDSDRGIMSAYLAGLKPIWIRDVKDINGDIKNKVYKEFESLDQIIKMIAP